VRRLPLRTSPRRLGCKCSPAARHPQTPPLPDRSLRAVRGFRDGRRIPGAAGANHGGRDARLDRSAGRDHVRSTIGQTRALETAAQTRSQNGGPTNGSALVGTPFHVSGSTQ
jgi:hypothetical protein